MNETQAMTPAPLSAETPLAELAATRAGASRVFHRHRLDFCCQGRRSVGEACEAAGIATADVLAELEKEEASAPDLERWDKAEEGALVEYVLDRFHAGHRAEVPRLIEMAEKVERVHADKATCPRGLTEHLRFMAQELELHMQKEEQILFPLIVSGRGAMAAGPIQVMEMEHVDHGKNLARLRELAHDFVPPAEACATWSALYLGLDGLESEVMQHIHLENYVLFPKVLGHA